MSLENNAVYHYKVIPPMVTMKHCVFCWSVATTTLELLTYAIFRVMSAPPLSCLWQCLRCALRCIQLDHKSIKSPASTYGSRHLQHYTYLLQYHLTHLSLLCQTHSFWSLQVTMRWPWPFACKKIKYRCYLVIQKCFNTSARIKTANPNPESAKPLAWIPQQLKPKSIKPCSCFY